MINKINLFFVMYKEKKDIWIRIDRKTDKINYWSVKNFSEETNIINSKHFSIEWTNDGFIGGYFGI